VIIDLVTNYHNMTNYNFIEHLRLYKHLFYFSNRSFVVGNLFFRIFSYPTLN